MKKQMKDTLKNKTVLMQFIVFPVIAVIMQTAVKIDDMPENFFIVLFATMYIGMAPLTGMSAVISEEKEKNTLRVLMMSNVKSWEYLFGIGAVVFTVSMAGALAIGLSGSFSGASLVSFMAIMAGGILTSEMIGAAIGVWSKNQMTATAISVPLMMIFAFLPMLASFNEKIEVVSRLTYSQQISNMMNAIGSQSISTENVLVVSANMLCVIVLFIIAYRKCGLT